MKYFLLRGTRKGVIDNVNAEESKAEKAVPWFHERKAHKRNKDHERFLRSNQIEAARVAMTRYIKRGGKVWINIFPDKPITAKPAETRMGSGKGSVEYWVAVVKPGRVLFEIDGVSEEIAREALRLAMHKLPCTCKICSREQVNGKEEEVANAPAAEGGDQ